MRSEIIFDKLLCIDTLLSFDAVIPSLAEFQFKLTQLLDAFYHQLLAEEQQELHAKILCQSLCEHLDRKIKKCVGSGLISWESYALGPYFYGYEEQICSVPEQLQQLLISNNEKIHACARQILSVIEGIDNHPRKIMQQAASFASMQPLLISPDEQQALIPPPGVPRKQVVFIIGPFASTWFNDARESNAVRFEVETVWLLAQTPQALSHRLMKIKEEATQPIVSAFFPILPDGVEDSEVMHSRLHGWFNSFSTLQLAAPLACTVGLYGRFSNERSAHDPDSAIWEGEFGAINQPLNAFSEISQQFLVQLETKKKERSPFALQRKALAKALFSWLDQSGLSRDLQQLFSTLPLRLNGMMLSDYGTGFTRHGAWSRWLEKKYALLPGLAHSLAMPPLPTVPVVLASPEFAYSPHQAPSKPVSLRTRKKGIIILGVAATVLLACLPGIFEWVSVSRDIETISAPGLSEQLHSATMIISAFPNNDTELTAQQEQELMALLPDIEKDQQRRFLILGYSDNTGSAFQNQKLSEQRAITVRNWIVQHSSLRLEQFNIRGFGDAFPVASNAQETTRANNRRVEIIPLN